ncbi:hypothetical protein MOB49_17535 [Bacillus haynesii]|uniref:hypothetical protein n=1 Tax=Bacillus haynesii TaxID=1925021 RepID=UPI00227EDD23|nr:hypothetical protein [Bacillus haynesii]MCY7845709.1 hypothetical protein [Bacillus haynesii]MCY7968865.1 hypothetical protein [Bacillus haynesii]MCY8019318.1 hypothetical protein [Bacillus haynesii]MCY8392269.1 hypothetical protein [Bacillus haynesii]MCY8584759.1 hypothetical protein [Bacillus haynesii]
MKVNRFKSIGIGTDPLKVEGQFVIEEHGITIEFDHSFSVKPFRVMMRKKEHISWIGFYGEGTYSYSGPFQIENAEPAAKTVYLKRI